MLVSNININKEGEHDFDVKLTPDEVQFLVNLALDYLVEKEYISINKSQEEYNIDLLNSIDTADMFKA